MLYLPLMSWQKYGFSHELWFWWINTFSSPVICHKSPTTQKKIFPLSMHFFRPQSLSKNKGICCSVCGVSLKASFLASHIFLVATLCKPSVLFKLCVCHPVILFYILLLLTYSEILFCSFLLRQATNIPQSLTRPNNMITLYPSKLLSRIIKHYYTELGSCQSVDR